MRAKTYDIEEIAKQIAYQGHSSKHKAEFKQHLGFDDKFELKLEKHIISTLKDKNTRVFQAADMRDVYFNRKTNTFIVVDLLNRHGGSCFLPLKGNQNKRNGIKYFIRELRDDIRLRTIQKNKMKRPVLKKGGFPALYKGKTIKKRLKQDCHRKSLRLQYSKSLNKGKTLSKDINNLDPKLKRQHQRENRAITRLKEIQKGRAEIKQNQQKHQEKIAERRARALQAKAKQEEARRLNRQKQARIEELRKVKARQEQFRLEVQKKREAEKQNQATDRNKRLEQLKKVQLQKKEEAQKAELRRQKERQLQEQEEERERLRQKRLKELEEARLRNTMDITKKH